MKQIIVFLVMFLLTNSCQKTKNEQKFNQIRLNVKRDFVIKNIGNPDYTYLTQDSLGNNEGLIDIYFSPSKWDISFLLRYKAGDSILINKRIEH